MANNPLLQRFVQYKFGKASGTSLVVQWDNYTIHTILDLTGGRRVIGHHHRLAKHLGLTHGHRLPFIAGWLHIDVASLYIGVRIAALTQQDDMFLRTYTTRTRIDSDGNLLKQPVLVSYNDAYAPIIVRPEMAFRICGKVLN